MNRMDSRVSGIDITAFVLAFFLPLIGFILGCVAVGEAHKQGRKAHGLADAAMWIGGVATVVIVIVLVAVAAHHPDPVQQMINCQQGQINGTVPLSVDCTQYVS